MIMINAVNNMPNTLLKFTCDTNLPIIHCLKSLSEPTLKVERYNFLIRS